MSDLFSLSGKTAVVTGGSRGIGLMIARGFVDAGASVYISSRKADVCEKVAAELGQHGTVPGPALRPLDRGRAAARLADAVAEREDCARHPRQQRRRHLGRARSTEHDDASWDRVLDLNVKGVFHPTKFLRPLLEAAGTADDPARVINIGSIDGIQVPMLETYSYSSSKAAVHQLTRHLARHLAPTITVNAIAPGPFESKMMAATLDAFGDQIAASAPLKRIGRPDDMAGTAVFLASRAGAYLTGAIIPVDGGIATIG